MTPLDVAMRLVGEVRERPGAATHPAIAWFHELGQLGAGVADAVPWCSSFANWVAWLCRCPRSRSALARSWLGVGIAVALEDARPGFDVVILKRGADPRLGHVGFFAGVEGGQVLVVGGNQQDGITQAAFPIADVLGVRRLRQG